jgi:protocatechuate 3,4-dioxygenase beta subunit
MENQTMENRILSRREMLVLMGGTVAVSAFACSASGLIDTDSAVTAGCVVSPKQTAGPYFVDEKLNRSDIRTDPANGTVSPGVPLTLALTIMQVGKNSCKPLPGATVDIWHCDALGVYSDVQDENFGNTKGKKFLRGYQLTDAVGKVNFMTIYPGWYPDRAVHIHYSVRTNPTSDWNKEFTSQLYFDEAVTDKVHALAPYKQKGGGRMMNVKDGIFRDGGSETMLKLTPKGEGYTAEYNIGFLTT